MQFLGVNDFIYSCAYSAGGIIAEGYKDALEARTQF
jgi:hypothetical protein